MKNSIALLFVSLTLVAVGCGGGGGKHGSNSSPSGTSSNLGESPQGFNGGLTGKIYFDRNSWYKALDITTGQRQDVYYMDHGHWATPRMDAQEFAVGANETKSGDYFSNEDVVFFNLDGQEADRHMINGEVQGIVKISPDGRFFAFDWYKDSKKMV